jgi:hypothetical protein
MENASKALVLAGGILLAMMILALLVYMLNAMSDFQNNQDTRLSTRQIESFNKTYLAYDKTIMHGIDIITLVNKAMEHNRTVGAISTNPDAHYINIIIRTNEEFKTTVMKIDNTQDYPMEEEINSSEEDDVELLTGEEISIESKLNANQVYQLGTWTDGGETLILNRNFEEFFEGGSKDITVTTNDKKTTYKIYSALTNFKKAIFRCADVNGDGEAIGYDEDGRIRSMEFIQL